MEIITNTGKSIASVVLVGALKVPDGGLCLQKYDFKQILNKDSIVSLNNWTNRRE